ncbi:4618_t:CDS:1, partial [Dentiscutata heterogama]
TNSRDSGVFFDLDFDFEINVSEKSSTPYSNYLGLYIPVKKSICKETDDETFFTIYPLEVVLPPKLPADTDVPFSFYLGLNTQKTTKREHRRSQRITSFYFVDLNSSNDNGLRSMDKTFTPKAG